MKKMKKFLAVSLAFTMVMVMLDLSLIASAASKSVTLTDEYYDVDGSGNVITATKTTDSEKMIENSDYFGYIKMSKTAKQIGKYEFEITINVQTTKIVSDIKIDGNTVYNQTWLYQARALTDLMPDYVTLQPSSITNENCSWQADTNTLIWNLESDTPVKDDGKTHELKYTITIDPTDLETDEIYPTNLQSTLTYSLSNTQTDSTTSDILSTLKYDGEANFLIPTVTINNQYNVTYGFESSTTEKTLPSEVVTLLPTDTNDYADGNEVTAIDPTQTTVTTSEGTWTFTGWNENSAIVTGADVIFIGTWTFTAKTDPIDSTDLENPMNPATGDTSTGLLFTLLCSLAGISLLLLTVVKKQRRQES